MSDRTAPNRIREAIAPRGFISAKAMIVLAVITAGAGALAIEWHHAHLAKTHQGSLSAHHHRKDETKSSANP